MELKLTPVESKFLKETLQERHRDLLREIAKTDHHEFKVALRSKAVVLEELLRKLTEGERAAA